MWKKNLRFVQYCCTFAILLISPSRPFAMRSSDMHLQAISLSWFNFVQNSQIRENVEWRGSAILLTWWLSPFIAFYTINLFENPNINLFCRSGLQQQSIKPRFLLWKNSFDFKRLFCHYFSASNCVGSNMVKKLFRLTEDPWIRVLDNIAIDFSLHEKCSSLLNHFIVWA